MKWHANVLQYAVDCTIHQLIVQLAYVLRRAYRLSNANDSPVFHLPRPRVLDCRFHSQHTVRGRCATTCVPCEGGPTSRGHCGIASYSCPLEKRHVKRAGQTFLILTRFI